MESDFKKKNIKEICIANKVSVLGLQETMVPLMSELQIRSFWGNNSFDFCSQSSRGKSGGLITIWDPVLFCKHSSFEGNDYLVVIGSCLPNAMQVDLINVYAPQQPAQKNQLWLSIRNTLLENSNMAWIVFGDFNEVREEIDRRGSRFNSSNAAMFNNFIASSRLFEIRCGRCRYTRIGSHGLKLSKLDRILVTKHFLICFQSSCRDPSTQLF